MKKIITHGGKAHLDDLMACAILIAHHEMWGDSPDGWTIERRDPATDELDYPTPDVFVVDVGGRYEPNCGLYDHHQLPRGSRDSAMSLLAANLGLPNGAFGGLYEPGNAEFPTDSMAEFLDKVFPWFRRRAELDSNGPFATAKAAGTDWAVIESFLGPYEDLVLAEFEKDPVAVATKLADMIVRKWNAYSSVASRLKVDLPWWSDGKLMIADFTAADPKETEEISDALVPRQGVAVFHDNRGDGLTLLRLGDDPRIDFTKVKDDPEVAFCHAGGFIVKTKTKDLEKAWRLIEDAYLGK